VQRKLFTDLLDLKSQRERLEDMKADTGDKQ
jgi:hypothetical protein